MFSINENSNIVIYGAATSGQIVYDILKKNQIDIIAFIDKRADELGELYGKRIVGSIDDIGSLAKTDCVVIIAVKNVFEHTKIADKLLKNGINCILYKPYSVLIGEGTDDEKKISECYDYLLSNQPEKLSYIPKTKDIAVYACKDSALVREEDDYVWARVPVCLIYANKTNEKESIWEDIPVLSMFPHIGLFRDCLCEQAVNGVEDYVAFCCEAAKNTGSVEITERWKENVVSNRVDVFHNMETAYELDKDFFVRNAPMAKWNAGGYFNLLGGKHRCTFLAAKGDQYVVLQISKKDYEKWVGQKKILDLQEYLDEFIQNKRGRGVIEHPYYYKYPLEGKTFIYKMWMHICGVLSQDIYARRHDFAFDGMTAFVSVEDMGYTARNLRRMGMKVYRKTKTALLEKKIGVALEVGVDQYIDKGVASKVDVAVVENEVYTEAKICFVVSDVRPDVETGKDSKGILLEGYVFPEKKYLYLMLND